MLHYTSYIKDDSATWVTFIHGAGGSSRIWFKQVREFQKYFNVLLIDLRGHGKSQNLLAISKYSFERIGDEVIEVLDHLDIKKSHFVGVSLGTIVIREISERYPDRSLSLIMSGAIMKLNFMSTILVILGDLLKQVIPHLVLYRIFAYIVMPHHTQKVARQVFIEEAQKMSRHEFVRWFSLSRELFCLLKNFRSRGNRNRTLYIMGDQDFMFLPSIKSIVQLHDLSTLKIIPNCGHVVNVQKAELFNQASIQFLNQ